MPQANSLSRMRNIFGLQPVKCHFLYATFSSIVAPVLDKRISIERNHIIIDWSNVIQTSQ